MVIDDINKGIEIGISLKKNKKIEIKPPRIGTAGIKQGKQYYSLVYRGKKLKTSADKDYLESLINNKEYLKMYKEKYLK